MGITSNDIAAQRAMLERGEEKRKADWKLSERERLRDTFAAAALTGLLADDGDRTEYAMPNFAARAYEWADAMLRERERTNHDAVPEATATTTPLNKGAACKTATSGTGNTPTLSESEREAIEWYADFPDGIHADTLRSLVDRLA